MRISLLSCDLRGVDTGANKESLRSFARFSAEQNVSCVLLHHCRQTGEVSPHRESESATPDNPAAYIRDCLAEFGVRYELFWTGAPDERDTESGAAVLSQLPILESFVETSGGMRRPDSTVVTRIALGLNTLFDAYCVTVDRSAPSEAFRAERLVSLVDATPELLAAQRPPRPKRRGPARKPPVRLESQVQSRVVLIAASVADVAASDRAALRESLASSNYAELTDSLSVSAATADRPVATPAVLFFLKPALRAQQVRLVFDDQDGPLLGDRPAVLAEVAL
jgi:hypothetical protein